jgi:uncharacterized membrane-anchored protein
LALRIVPSCLTGKRKIVELNIVEELLEKLLVIVRWVSTLGFITVGGFIIGIEYKFYKKHFTDNKKDKILFFFAVALTVLVWLFMYFIVFKSFQRS